MGFKPGDKIGGYEIAGELGVGGMGKVYRVKNLISERMEAMKVLLPNLAVEAELADRFMREIRVHARLQHPNIAALNNAFEYENQLVMVMELVEGSSLQERLNQGALTLEQTVDYGSQMLRALAYAHQQGVVHRDIKPGNMMLTPGGTVKLLDFGIAKASEDRKLTKTGMALGSIYYMAPEQIQGTPPDPRSDLYSLGIVLYQFATGYRPIEGDSEFAIMSAHLKTVPVPPVERDPRIPAALSDVIMMALRKEPEKRFQSADAFLLALESVQRKAAPLAQAQAPVPPPMPFIPGVQAAPAPGKYRAAYMLAGAVAALVVLAVAAVQIPKQFGAHASAPAVARDVPAQVRTPAQLQPLPQAQPDGATQTPPVSPGAAAVTVEKAVQSPPPVATRIPPVSQGRSPVSVEKSVQSPPPLHSQAVTPQSPPQGNAAVPNQPPVITPRETGKEAEKLQESLTLMDARMVAVNGSLEQLRQSQAASGLSLRADMVSTQQLMRSFFAQADNSLRSGDIAAAKRHMERSELNLEKLEKFLSGGR